jgi:hypothetical protein
MVTVVVSHRFQCEAQLTARIALAIEGIAFTRVHTEFKKKECTSSADHCKISGLCRQNNDV